MSSPIPPPSGEGPPRHRLLRLLEPLRRDRAGKVLYGHLEAILARQEAWCLEVQEAYAALTGLLLERWAQALPEGSPQRLHLRLLQARLQPPLDPDEVAGLRRLLEAHAGELARAGAQALEEALRPLLAELEGGGVPAAPTEAASPRAAANTPAEGGGGPAPGPEEQRVDLRYRRHLDEKRLGIQRIQRILAEQITHCRRNSEAFAATLREGLARLRRSDAEEEAARARLIAEMERLLEAQERLNAQLEDAGSQLQVIEADSRRLTEELARIHLLSLTDELTGLPNRRAFLRRLQEEVGRVQRYGHPLSLALLDLDGFKAVNDRHGHAAGDEVLRTYAAQVLAVFRHHDMVARYGGEEFAVLLPNTHTEGAARALAKVQKRAAETTFEHGGRPLPLPTFSAGLALYRPGESPEAFIERADRALYRAKRLGRNRVELAEEEPRRERPVEATAAAGRASA